MLHCRDLSVTSIVRVHSAGHFLLAENEHAHHITTTWPSERERRLRVCRELRFSLAIMPPSKVCPQCQSSVPLKLKLCKCCQHVFQSKRKAEYSLSDQATKRMRVSKATKRVPETSEQTLHRQQQDEIWWNSTCHHWDGERNISPRFTLCSTIQLYLQRIQCYQKHIPPLTTHTYTKPTLT